MINQEELTICKRRGHAKGALREDWSQCEWCGAWVREVRTRTIEEREDEPPEAELDPDITRQRQLDRLGEELARRGHARDLRWSA